MTVPYYRLLRHIIQPTPMIAYEGSMDTPQLAHLFKNVDLFTYSLYNAG
ncbi:MAG: hypothetical protein JWN12_817 [Candidatus Saccharibacteria bacterium]|nr:hypothetical protein [Candidatus Saccharibacteria bacterium]